MNSKLIYGWGINDADYVIETSQKLPCGKNKRTWRCPYYCDWVSMLRRCFSKSYQKQCPTYIGCTISEEWRYFSNFKRWVDSQPNKDWQNCQPDKDFLGGVSKHYSPETVVYIPKNLNLFIIGRGRDRGDCMIGAVFSDNTGTKENQYQAFCSNPFTKRQEYLGSFPTELDAHLAWKAKKHDHACRFADIQSDKRVADRLKEMYNFTSDLTSI